MHQLYYKDGLYKYDNSYYPDVVLVQVLIFSVLINYVSMLLKYGVNHYNFPPQTESRENWNCSTTSQSLLCRLGTKLFKISRIQLPLSFTVQHGNMCIQDMTFVHWEDVKIRDVSAYIPGTWKAKGIWTGEECE